MSEEVAEIIAAIQQLIVETLELDSRYLELNPDVEFARTERFDCPHSPDYQSEYARPTLMPQ